MGVNCDISLYNLIPSFIFFNKTLQMGFLTLKACTAGLTIQPILISLFLSLEFISYQAMLHYLYDDFIDQAHKDRLYVQ